MAAAVHRPLHPLHPAVVAPVLVHPVQAGAVVLLLLLGLHLALHLALGAHPLSFAAVVAAAASASDAAGAAGALQQPGTWS